LRRKEKRSRIQAIDSVASGSGNEIVKPSERVKEGEEKEKEGRMRRRSRRKRELRIDFQFTLIDSSIGLTESERSLILRRRSRSRRKNEALLTVKSH